MTKKLLLLLTLLTLLTVVIAGCDNNKQKPTEVSKEETMLSRANQQDIDNIADALQIKYQLLTNVPSEQCDKNIAESACFTVRLDFTATQPLLTKDWAIYFSHIAPIQSYESDEFSVQHLNGDLHRITLNKAFTGFNQGDSKSLVFRAMFWSLSEYDAMPNYIVTSDIVTSTSKYDVDASRGIIAKVIKSTQTAIDKESQLELLPFVQPYGNEDKYFQRNKNDNTAQLTPQRLYQRNLAVNRPENLAKFNPRTAIIPTPKFVKFDPAAGIIDITDGVNIDYGKVKIVAVSAAIQRLTKLGIKLSEQGVPLTLTIIADSNKKAGSYQLNINHNNIVISGVDNNGVFNGLQSLASLKELNSNQLPLLVINDEPHYDFRGMMVDVAGNFHSKNFILKLLEQMAAYKLNKLHLHLADDEGWRLEIPGLPELTDVASKRCFDQQEQQCLLSQLGSGVDEKSAVNGFYSVSDYQEILAFANERHIQVIPSLDMPGHSRAAITAMTVRYNTFIAQNKPNQANQFRLHDLDDKTKYSSVQFYDDNTINGCLDSSYTFVSEVMKQVKKMHADGGQSLTRYHIGAD